MRDPNELFAALARSRFRSRCRLDRQDFAYLRRNGLSAVRDHARRFVTERLAEAEPPGDGKQTPMRGHPVFVAQHATATCCRGCLEKWHGIAAGRALKPQEVDYVVETVARWLTIQMEEVPSQPQAERQLPLWGQD